MEEKRKVQAKKDAEEAKANEAIRRKGGKDQQQLKAELQLKEAEKAALQRKKGEHLERRSLIEARSDSDRVPELRFLFRHSLDSNEPN